MGGFQRRLAILLLGALPACVVDTPIAERVRSAEQELLDEVDDWCWDVCSRLVVDCEDEPCPCDSDAAPSAPGLPPPEDCACEPRSVGECALDCDEIMAGFSGHGEECAAAGVESMGCIDAVETCDELKSASSNCFREPDGVAACNGGAVACQDMWGGSGGSASISPPMPAGNSGVPAPGAAGTSSVAYTSCDFGANDCSDGADYYVSCAGVGVLSCVCFRSSAYETSFELPGGDCYLAYYLINPGCGWNVADFE